MPDGSGGELTVTIRQEQKRDWPAFRMPMQLLVVRGGEERRLAIEVSGRESVVRLRLPDGPAPNRVELDPDGWILRGSL